MKTILGLLLVALSPSALACYSPPPGILRDHSALVSESGTIVIVEAVATSTGCELQVVRTLKGTPPQALPIGCRRPGPGDWMTSFSGHTEKSFWEGRGGRLGIEGDCSVIAPAFEIGRSYLLLLGVRPDTKQFEQIDGADDQWLRFVEQVLVEQRVPPKPLRGSA